MRFTLPRQRPRAEFASTLRIGNGDRASAADLLGLRCGAIYRANRMQPPSFQRKHGCKNTRIHRTLADRQAHYRVLRFRPCVAGSVCCLGKFALASPARDNTLVLPVQNPLFLHGMAAIETSRGHLRPKRQTFRRLKTSTTRYSKPDVFRFRDWVIRSQGTDPL